MRICTRSDMHLGYEMACFATTHCWWEHPTPQGGGGGPSGWKWIGAKRQDAGGDERCWVSALGSPALGLPRPTPPPPPGPQLPGSLHSRVEPLGWSQSPHTQPSFHHLPFIQRLAYPNFFFPCCLCNEKLSTRSLIKFYAYPHPQPPNPCQKKERET